MVLFNNVNVNQKVEILCGGQVRRGVVKYKGPLISLDGDWVGIALDAPEGSHNGLYKGRRYFECKDRHGVFVRASRLRLIQNTRRCLFNKYHSRRPSHADELLFGSCPTPEVMDGPYDPAFISSNYKQRATDVFDTVGSRFESSRSFPLNHTVSKSLPAATMIRPHTAAATFTYTSRPVHTRPVDKMNWQPVPTIPKTHMPFSAQRNQTKKGWENAHLTRELSDPLARHSIKSHRWNDVSF